MSNAKMMLSHGWKFTAKSIQQAVALTHIWGNFYYSMAILNGYPYFEKCYVVTFFSNMANHPWIIEPFRKPQNDAQFALLRRTFYLKSWFHLHDNFSSPLYVDRYLFLTFLDGLCYKKILKIKTQPHHLFLDCIGLLACKIWADLANPHMSYEFSKFK